MNRTHRVRQTYVHRLRDAIAATGNAELFRDVAIPASTRRTWARGEVRPVVAAVDVELEVYDLLEHVDRLRQRARAQAAIIGLLVQLLNLRGGKLDGDRVPDGASKSAVLRAVASAAGLLSLSTALKIVGISSARYHAWRRGEEGCGLDDQPSCPKSFPSQLTRDEGSTMRDCVESETYRHIAVQNLALYAQRLGKVFASASTWYKMIRQRGWKRPRRRVHPAKPKQSLRATCPNEYWQIDATVIRLTTGIRIYLQAVIDNFSRTILAWRVSDKLSSATTRELLGEPPSRRSERQRARRHRRRFGELRRGRSASRGFKFSESCARPSRHSLLELFDRSILATIEARVAFPEHPRQYGGREASRRVLRP